MCQKDRYRKERVLFHRHLQPGVQHRKVGPELFTKLSHLFIERKFIQNIVFTNKYHSHAPTHMCIGQLQLSFHLVWDNPHIPEYVSPHVRYSLNPELQLSCLFYMVRINLVSEHSYFCKGHIILKYYINEHYVYQTKSAKFKKPFVCTFPVVTKTVRT